MKIGETWISQEPKQLLNWNVMIHKEALKALIANTSLKHMMSDSIHFDIAC